MSDEDMATKTVRKNPQDRLLSRKKPQTAKVRISFDSDIADRYEDAKTAHDIAKDAWRRLPDSPELRQDEVRTQAALEQIEEEYKQNSVEFVFRGLGPKRWDALVAAHPVTQDVKKEARSRGVDEDEIEGLSWNPYTFPQALILAACVYPEITEEEVNEIFDGGDWNNAELGALLGTAVIVNTTRRVAELGKG